MHTQNKFAKTHRVFTAFLLMLVLISSAFGSGNMSTALASEPTSGSYYYYADNKRIQLTPSLEWVSVKFASNEPTKQVAALQDFTALTSSWDQGLQIPHRKLTLLPLQKGLTLQMLAQDINSLREDTASFLQVNPVFHTENNEMVITDEFIATFPAEKSKDEIDIINAFHKVEIVEPMTDHENTFILRVTTESQLDALSMANLYIESGVAILAAPNFLYIMSPEPVENQARQASVRMLATNESLTDPYYPDQWYLNNIGYYGNPADIDIDAPEAWSILPADSTTTIIAVLDSGVDLDHEDLKGKMVLGHDSTDFAEGGGGSSGNHEDNAHGTNIAGLAAASTNNFLGVAGICQKCLIMSVRIMYVEDSGKRISEASWLAEGIRWAYKNGASILTNSWNFDTPHDEITTAIAEATILGRDNKGSIVVFGAGNGGTASMPYPTYLDNVIAVGASNMCDHRKTDSSDPNYSSLCDGYEYWWGSSYGSALDISAPGIWLYTTDISSLPGYDPSDYNPNFNGTSGAAPIVAGVAGLVLSVNPSLTQNQVKTILENNADDIESIGWDMYTGYGRVNAHRAVEAALLSIGTTVTPAPPSNLQVTAISATEVQLIWTDNSNNETGFVVYEGDLFIITTLENISSTVIQNLPPNSTHCYRVNAYNAYGYSELSNETCINLTPKPGDANGDGKVDGVDYVIWLNHYGQSTPNGPADGDFDYSGLVDYADYQIWLENYTG